MTLFRSSVRCFSSNCKVSWLASFSAATLINAASPCYALLASKIILRKLYFLDFKQSAIMSLKLLLSLTVMLTTCLKIESIDSFESGIWDWTMLGIRELSLSDWRCWNRMLLRSGRGWSSCLEFNVFSFVKHWPINPIGSRSRGFSIPFSLATFFSTSKHSEAL